MFNSAYRKVFGTGNMTLGLMTPVARKLGEMSDVALELAVAKRADQHSLAALWARDVPLMIPQGTDGEIAALDDPFVWLTALGAVAPNVALGTAAAVLPLRNPLHLAKAALSLDRMTDGRFLLGLGSGDRQDEFAAFGLDPIRNGTLFRDNWATLKSAISPDTAEREQMLAVTGGFEVTYRPEQQIPMIVVGSAKQSLQWIAANADGWATYHREEQRQQGRINLWSSALQARAEGQPKPFVQSLHLDLRERADAPAEPIELGIRAGRIALFGYLERMAELGVGHILLHLLRGGRPTLDIIDELGADVLPKLRALGVTRKAASHE